MTKSVQFSSTNILYSPLLWSPSPEASTSSLPHSPSRDQPARQIPIIYRPWPSPMPVGMSPGPDAHFILCRAQIHILLAFAPSMPPHVHYDLSHPLHTINSQLTPSFLDPATYPPLPTLTILCRHIPWPIAVAPSQPTGFVSVFDVFMSVYTSLWLAVRRAEYDALLSSEARHRVDEAYFTRCRLWSDDEERRIEALKGVKRVDFLVGKTRFLGLSGPVEGAHVWELNVS
ncbi:hypothetical protein B0H19DRAFT_964625 [Mycena capillaripes]|nr:hypothetical protein B0H19DRAFT_964625 [Mycena capillaripes]